MKATIIIVSVCAVLMLSSIVGLAKRETIGIYAIVDKVAFEPDAESPERIRIWGMFIVPVPRSSGQYKSPQRGYLYFRIAPGMEQVAKREWAALKNLAGLGQGIGFAQYWVASAADPSGNPHHSLKVQVYRDGDAAVPDVYPIPHMRGIMKTGDKADPDFEKIMTELRRAAHH
jgi:hypothetical protein